MEKTLKSKTTAHEEFCRTHFDAWLERTGLCPNRQWERGPDPPDFVLTTKCARYSVEVSRLTDENLITASVSLSRLVDDLEKDYSANGPIPGTYIVDPEETLPQGAKYRRELRRAIREFIERTKSDTRPSTEFLQIEGRRVVRVEKYSAAGSGLFCNGLSGGGWEDDIRREYESVVGDLLRRKRACLEVHAPAILVLQDGICPISPRILSEVIHASPDAAAFEAIYVIRDEVAGDIVCGHAAWAGAKASR